jgi:hypothetical protein
MPKDPDLIFVKEAPGAAADLAGRARRRAREAVRMLAEAEVEHREAFAELDRVVGPDPRTVVAGAAVEEFLGQIVGCPSIPSA